MVRVHIKRNIPEDKSEELNDLIKELRGMTMGQPGYITGATLKRVDKPGESLVSSKWQSIESWNPPKTGKPNFIRPPKADKPLADLRPIAVSLIICFFLL